MTNVPDYCVDEVSDHALALVLSLARQIVAGRSGSEERKLGRNGSCRDPPASRANLGLLGFGKIANALRLEGAAVGNESSGA